jgi:hypothetical protein
MARPYIYQENWPTSVNEYVDSKINQQKIPTQAELAYTVLYCDEDTITNYIHEKDESNNPLYLEFCKAIRRLKLVQKHMLIEKGLEKTWHFGVVNMLLASNHNMNKNYSDAEDDSEIKAIKIQIVSNSDRQAAL